MSNLSVIIPSKTLSNLEPCVDAVHKHEPHARVFVVDDGLPDCIDVLIDEWFRVIPGVKPFIFSRNMNLGIAAAGEDDVVLLNDDAILESLAGFISMQAYAESRPDIGLISATTNFAGNPEQLRRGFFGMRVLERATPGNSFPTVAFVCVLIPRRTINAVGLLDESFTGYGWEDNDYCRRVYNAGLKIGVHDGCYVDHGKLKSTFRGEPSTGGKLEEGKRIYMEKWGSV